LQATRPFPSLEGLNSSLAQSAGWVMAMGIIYPESAFVGVEYLLIFVFWTMIFAPDMLESQSRALKTRMIA